MLNYRVLRNIRKFLRCTVAWHPVRSPKIVTQLRLVGNRPLEIPLPKEVPTSTPEVRLYLGTLSMNGMKPNPDRKWFQFWKPKMVPEPVTECWTKTTAVPINFTSTEPKISPLFKSKDPND